MTRAIELTENNRGWNEIDRFIGSLIRRGYIRGEDDVRSFDRGDCRYFSFSLQYGEVVSFRAPYGILESRDRARFLEMIDQDIRWRYAARNGPQATVQMSRGELRAIPLNAQPVWGDRFVSWDYQRDDFGPISRGAAKQAEKLFKRICGEEAHRRLDSNLFLPIIGSEGTHYALHKRQSYCLQRSSDGLKFCAMVPGVPLWDHLLGIKLMVENDEPSFLQIANVADVVAHRAPEISERHNDGIWTALRIWTALNLGRGRPRFAVAFQRIRQQEELRTRNES